MRAAALLVLAFVLGAPTVAGLVQTCLGGIPALGELNLSGLGLALSSGLLATFLSLGAALGLCAQFPRRLRLFTLLSLPLLAAPHGAVGQALSLLLAPSGFLVRAFSPWATGFERPPVAWLYDMHPSGGTLIAALMIKELAFFYVLIAAHSATLPRVQWQRTASALGHHPVMSWWHHMIPSLSQRLLLPVGVVLAFALSVVDVAVLVGPSRVRTFAHRLHDARQSAAPWGETLAGALVLLGVSLGLLLLVWVALRLRARIAFSQLVWPGRWRSGGVRAATWGLALLGLLVLALAYLSLGLLPLESVLETSGRRSNFPDLWPGGVQMDAWQSTLRQAVPTLPTTLLLAAGATAFSLLLVVWVLEAERRGSASGDRAVAWEQGRWGSLDTWLLVPLLMPQFAFLSGSSLLGIRLNLIPAQGFAMALWFHMIFVLPYVFLVFAPAYRALPRSLDRAAAALGHGPWSAFWRLRLPLTLRPLVFACAWGMSVSLALYLPTFFAAAGRLETLLTLGVRELAGKGDGVRAAWGLLLLLVPLTFFVAAWLAAAWQSRNRMGLRG